MAEKYPFQFNVKVGDHLLNINGESIEEAVTNLETVAGFKDRIHAAIEQLDGRPATEVVQKEKQWGGRSQYGRTYTKSATSQSAPSSAPAETSTDATSLLKSELGATVVETTPNTTETPSASERLKPSEPEKVKNGRCSHGAAINKSGTNSRGKDWEANFCSAKKCDPEWL